MRTRSLGVLVATAIALSLASTVDAAFIAVYGGPTFDSSTGTGFQLLQLPIVNSTAGNGTAVGDAVKYSSNVSLGYRAVRWDASGNAATELGNLGTDGSGSTYTYAYTLNATGAAVGFAEKYNSSNTDLGSRAVRWDASGTTATELGNLGTKSSGSTEGSAVANNAAGIAVGYALKLNGDTDIGSRAVRWDAAGTATELGNLGTDSSGVTQSGARAVNALGTAVGYAQKYSGGTFLGVPAVRWDASGTAATELGSLSIKPDGTAVSSAVAINTAGTAVGYTEKYSGTIDLGQRAVRWDAAGTAVTELGNLGTDSNGTTNTNAFAINAAGTAVGAASKVNGDTYLGGRAVRWDAIGTTATELGNLGTDSNGITGSDAYAINPAAIVVVFAQKYVGGTNVGQRAVLWSADGVAVDINTLINPISGWTLTEADGISDTNWVTGLGQYDPDGAGPLSSYQRAFLLDVSSAVPEPASLGVISLAAIPLLRRRRKY